MDATANNILDQPVIYSKISAYARLTKFRLGALVVFSAVITYLTVMETFSWAGLFALAVGGFMVTAAANGYNQVIERNLDKLMDRTKARPMPTESLTPAEGMIFCTLMGITGIVVLWLCANPLCALLGLVSIILYAAVYTPLKQRTPFSVFVGAFPGALPTLIGGVAATPGFGEITFFAMLLFMIQFVWQFPHFWSLAWFNSEDYAKANFHLLPSQGGKDEFTRFQVLLYCAFLMVMSVLPFVFGFTGILSTSACIICGLAMLLQAYNFYRYSTDANARKLFFVTLVYLPLVQLALMTKA